MTLTTARGQLIASMGSGAISKPEFILQIQGLGQVLSVLWDHQLERFYDLNRRYLQNEEGDKLQGFTEKEIKEYMALLYMATPKTLLTEQNENNPIISHGPRVTSAQPGENAHFHEE